jgi:hypothetical protein
VDAVKPLIRGLLQACPTMPATVSAERIGWQRGLKDLKDRVRELRPAYLPPDRASRTAYDPGELAQCDFWFPPVTMSARLGQVRWATRLPVLTMVSGYSRWLPAVLVHSFVATRVNSGAVSSRRTASPATSCRPGPAREGAASRSGVSGHNSIHAMDPSSPSCSLDPLAVSICPVVQGLAAVPVFCRPGRLVDKTRTAVSPGSTSGSSPYPRTSTRANVPLGKADSNRFRTESAIASSTRSARSCRPAAAGTRAT